MSVKSALYNFFGSRIGKIILKLFSKFITVSNLKKHNCVKNNANGNNTEKNNIKNKIPKKFLISLTIDTESGFVKENNERLWQNEEPEAYLGYYKGIENWRNLLNKYNAKATFFLSTNCFSAKGNDFNKIKNQLDLLIKEGHEIGLHMHPDSDLAMQMALKERFNNTGARFYNLNQINKFIKMSRQLLQKNLGINPVSFRWGNWALNTDAVRSLQENGFIIDSSATPGIKGHLNDGMHYDWSKVDLHYPWKLSLKDYQNTKQQNSKVLEIPIATFNLFGATLRADPVYSKLLKGAFDYYYRNADRSKNPFAFVVISHSIEATHEDGSFTRVIRDTEDFIKYAKKLKEVEFVTIENAYKGVK